MNIRFALALVTFLLSTSLKAQWQLSAPIGKPNTSSYLHGFSSGNAILVEDNATAYLTSDFGNTWLRVWNSSNVGPSETFEIYDLDFYDNTFGAMVGFDFLRLKALILITTDGGRT